MFNNVSDNRRKRVHIPSLGLSNKDCVASDESITITITFSILSNDKIIVMSLENEIHTIAMWPEEDKSHGHDSGVTWLRCCDELNNIEQEHLKSSLHDIDEATTT